MMHTKLIAIVTTTFLGVFLCGCAGTVVKYEQLMLNKADSLFYAGNYEYAKVSYAKIRDAYPQTDAAKSAQFQLGYINIYYDNPFATYEGALREFRAFATLYPQDNRIGEVYSWIRILVAMQSFKKDYLGSVSQLDQLKVKEQKENDTKAQQARKIDFNAITESLKGCFDSRDSLARKTKDLENVILDLERKCQQAGK